MKAPACFDDPDTRKTIDAVCRHSHIDLRLLKELCEVVQKYSGSGRAEGVTVDITQCIDAFVARANGSGTEG